MTEQAPILKQEAGPISIPAQYHCHASQNGAASFGNGVALTWDTIVEDTAGMSNTGTPPVTWVTIPVDGIYMVSFGFYDSTAGNTALYVRHNNVYNNNVYAGGESVNHGADASRTAYFVRRYTAGATLYAEVAGANMDVLAGRKELYWFTVTKIA